MLGEAPHYQAGGNVLYSIKTGQPSFDDLFGMGVFEYFQTHPLDAEIFEQSMNSFSFSKEKAILAVYNFSEFQTLVDVGGEYGEMLGTILEQGYGSQKNRYFYGFLLFLFTYFLSILFLWYGNWGWIT